MRRYLTSVVVTVLLLAGVTARPAAAQAWPVDCERPQHAEQRQAVETATALFEQSWRRHGSAAMTAFEMKPEKLNPFDVKREAPVGQQTLRGYIHAQRVECLVTKVAERDYLIEVSGLDVRFFEPEPGWSEPQSRGLLFAARVAARDEKLAARDAPDAATVVLPDAVLRKPTAEELPRLPSPRASRRPNR